MPCLRRSAGSQQRRFVEVGALAVFAGDLDGDGHLDVVSRDGTNKKLIHGISNR